MGELRFPSVIVLCLDWTQSGPSSAEPGMCLCTLHQKILQAEGQFPLLLSVPFLPEISAKILREVLSLYAWGRRWGFPPLLPALLRLVGGQVKGQEWVSLLHL